MSILELITCYWLVPALCVCLALINLLRKQGRTPEHYDPGHTGVLLVVVALWPVGAFVVLWAFWDVYEVGEALIKERGGNQ